MSESVNALRNCLASLGRVADLIEDDDPAEALELLHAVMDDVEESIDELGMLERPAATTRRSDDA